MHYTVATVEDGDAARNFHCDNGMRENAFSRFYLTGLTSAATVKDDQLAGPALLDLLIPCFIALMFQLLSISKATRSHGVGIQASLSLKANSLSL